MTMMTTEPVRHKIQVLDRGYIELIEHWGSDERIIEAARQSTDKGFLGWGPYPCMNCFDANRCNQYGLFHSREDQRKAEASCKTCKGAGKTLGDEKLLRDLFTGRNHQTPPHTSPFEMAGAVIEVQAPIFVFREWHRHRTQSYNEMSARYVPLPNVNYRPTRERILAGAATAGANKQAAGTTPLVVEAIDDWLKALDSAYEALENTYQVGLQIGIPKELARLVVPVGRYSRMRASANLLNWLRFLTLRMHPSAQWEIRQYAIELAGMLMEKFPRTMALFAEEQARQRA